MKKFLFPTDFSANAKHALNYGYSLAKQVKANMIICNAIIEPAEIPQSGLVSWPMEESDLLQADSNRELKLLKEQMESREETISFNPSITCISEAGTVTDMINRVGHQNDVGLVIIGTHGSSGLSTLLLGDHSREIIDEINKPLLLVPPAAKIKQVKKIAFATDFKDPVKDMECIHAFITLARPLNAEILITNIFDEEEHAAEWFMNELANKANYPHIYYRVVKAYHPVSGLDWLCEHGDIDMLAMVHRSHNFIDSLFRGSQTQKMANHIVIPLLVFPAI
ncbi:Nucleotide-binding universal stress protein, UspA family [Mucilaginibacter mallensis]|uniref:Nucleotide-binding universal stress protein, UspA family n=1 Tax=Mucilaginibacter mallensis TaxID=652787 RepID=A0A1H1UFS4_MUCMA|nr:universal stress protein [Mucilaginibacter mallensis]SDS71131.1 Nucleotide-binding universal stress protein, UspA family [Mucilaginibacter mallensis]